MSLEDIDAVMAIEHEAFSAPWSARAYDYELRFNEMARYYVARPQTERVRLDDAPKPFLLFRRTRARARVSTDTPLVGYAGFWLLVDEAHISTIATHRDWRGRGIGELLLLATIDGATEIGAAVMTLEVRASNLRAQSLYRKYGFTVVGERRNYYTDNGEDALIMTTPRLTSAEYRRQVRDLQAALYARWRERGLETSSAST